MIFQCLSNLSIRSDNVRLNVLQFKCLRFCPIDIENPRVSGFEPESKGRLQNHSSFIASSVDLKGCAKDL